VSERTKKGSKDRFPSIGTYIHTYIHTPHAGLHFEDAYLHSLNVMPSMDLDMSSCTAEDEAIVSTYVKLAKLRQWIFPPLDTNGYTTSMYIASLFGVKTEGDALLVSRMVCVNPEWAERQKNWGVLRQGEGDVILADHAHAVFGMSFLNMAWNVFFPSYAQTYVQRAVQVTDMIRQRNADDVKECWDDRDIQRSLSLSTCIINCALRSDVEGCVYV